MSMGHEKRCAECGERCDNEVCNCKLGDVCWLGRMDRPSTQQKHISKAMKGTR